MADIVLPSSKINFCIRSMLPSLIYIPNPRDYSEGKHFG